MILNQTKIDIYERCQQGDSRAQLQLYNDYAHGMYNVAMRLVNDSALAEDLMQESMITAFEKMDQWNREASYGSWLKRIVINNCLSYLRKANRMPLTTLEDYHEQVEDPSSIEVKADDYTVQNIIAAIQQLSVNYREIITLSLIEGMDNEEIAQIMGISNGACRTAISRAKLNLRTILQQQ